LFKTLAIEGWFAFITALEAFYLALKEVWKGRQRYPSEGFFDGTPPFSVAKSHPVRADEGTVWGLWVIPMRCPGGGVPSRQGLPVVPGLPGRRCWQWSRLCRAPSAVPLLPRGTRRVTAFPGEASPSSPGTPGATSREAQMQFENTLAGCLCERTCG